MKQIYLGLAFHNHQPVGNFPAVFAEAYRKAYLPMLEALEKHPTVKATLHYSGPLVDWIKDNHRDFFPRVAALVKCGQAEIMSGGYYEPILPMIPDPDKLGQVRKMNEWVNDEFGTKPSGMWLAERVWEPGLARPIAETGLQYTLVDDTHFRMVGLEDGDLTGYYLTEEQGYPLRIFPISKQLRYSIPWKLVPEVIQYLKDESAETPRIAVLGDDGEKFGIWPQTYRHCWKDGWVESFFKALEDNREWLHTVTLGDYAQRFPPVGRVYLPCAAYDEMLEWALPSDKSAEFVDLKHRLEAEGRPEELKYLRGGFWRYFLVKYPEINRMHKRMMQAHRAVHQAEWLGVHDIGLDDLWKAQCNCPYWHGVFGGIYLSDIRAETFSHLIRAELEAGKALREKVAVSVRQIAEPSVLKHQRLDYDQDGHDELVVENGASNIYFSPREGGSIIEWDVFSPPYNLLSTVARRPEPYHRLLKAGHSNHDKKDGVASIHDELRVKAGVTDAGLVYDRYPRHSLLDHILEPGTTLEQFSSGSARWLDDFAGRPYGSRVSAGASRLVVSLDCQGTAVPVTVEKEIELHPNEAALKARYSLKNIGQQAFRCLFAVEWNINLLGGGHNPRAYYRLPGLAPDNAFLDTSGVHEGLQTIVLGNRQMGIELAAHASRPFSLWHYPVESVSSSEGGVEKVYQASCLVFVLPVDLPPGAAGEFGLTWQVRSPSV
jgi:alpha-amylase